MDVYREFANLYASGDYPQYSKNIAGYLPGLLTKLDFQPKTILDVACGEGTFAIEMAKQGYEVTGIDQSPDMLTIARKKARKENIKLDFRQMDMRQITFNKSFDLATSWFDSLNYIHEIDFLQWYFGPVKWVFGRVDTMVHDVEVEDVATAVIKFKKGVMSTFTCSTAAMASKAPELEIFGTEGSISLVAEEIEDMEVPYPMVTIVVHKNGGWRTVPIRDSLDVVERWRGKIMPYTVPLHGISSIESLVAHLDEFLTCILEDKGPAVPGEEGIKATEIVQAIYRSSREGVRVELPL